MKEYFDTQIKPLHDELTKQLGKTKVTINKFESEYEIPVNLKVHTGASHYEYMTNIKLRNLRAIGVWI